MKKIGVLLVDDHAVVRAGIRMLLEASGDVLVVGEAENGQEGARAAQRLHPDVVLLDLGMPRLNGVQFARHMIRKFPRTRVLVLSGYADEQHVSEALEAGVAGYVLKQSASIDLLEAIRQTANGEAYFSPGVLNHIATQLRNPLTSRTPALSYRHAQVLQLIAEGYCTKEIASMLCLSEKTIERHRYRLMMKLNIHKIAALTRYAVSAGIIESPGMPNWPARPMAASPLKSPKKSLMM